MEDISWLQRTQLLVGEERLMRLVNAHVLVVGLGGVGSFAAEFIARSGVGKMTIVDGDTVDPTNRNRQLPALATNHGQPKADIMEARLRAINPEIELTVVKDFMVPEKMQELLTQRYDYVVDAIDSLMPKLKLLSTAYYNNQRIVSSMGAGGKLDPTRIQVADLSKTHNDRLAFYVRKRLRKFNIHSGIKAVFSPEPNVPDSLMFTDGSKFKRSAFGTVSYLPAAFGGACASVVIRDIVGM
jgi:tRNA threonylcarbamoyladenosine dehydratase